MRGIHHRVPRAAHLVEATNQHIRLTALDSTAIQIQQHLYLIKKTAVVNPNYFTSEMQLWCLWRENVKHLLRTSLSLNWPRSVTLISLTITLHSS